MKKLIFIFAAICGCLLLSGCATFEEEEESIPAATVEQTAAVFNEVIARDNCDVVMCHLVKHEHATCGTAIKNIVVRHDWYEVIYSVKNFLMIGDKFVISQHIDSPLEEYTPCYRTYNNSEVVYFEIDKDYASISGPETAPGGNQYYIWFTGGPEGDLLNPARIGQKYDYLPNAKEAFFRVKKSYWQKRDPNVNIHWHQGPRQTPVKSGKMEKEK
ncbi:MAG: hypothetical protein E7058_10175 [Lentisphaerae bacterium]|nr:hypothetical protein [Lentisphaerota bacterium]